MVGAPVGLGATITLGALAAGIPAIGAGSSLLEFLVMNKIRTTVLGVIAAAIVTPAIIEVHATRSLADELAKLRSQEKQFGQIEDQNRILLRSVALSGETNSISAELAVVRGRIAQMLARPPTVVDSAMKQAAEWRNAGFATPAASVETQLWALTSGNFDVAATAIILSRETKQKADAFFSTLSVDVRAKFGSSERLFAPMFTPWGKKGYSEPVAFQVLGVTEEGPNFVYVKAWTRDRNGHEGEMRFPLTRDSGGWRFGPIELGSWWETAAARVDRTTGAILAPKQ
jgi:hypothetical protein